MSTTPLREILLLCRSLDATASEIYQTISTQVADDDQRDFWVDVSQDEARHAAYWEQLIALEGEGKLNHVFDRPD